MILTVEKYKYSMYSTVDVHCWLEQPDNVI